MSSWLGDNVTTLKFKDRNLKKLIINSEVENHDIIIIYSILKSLFPSTGINNNSKNINQKRYFPIYFGNNVFNESFSFTELTKALEDIKIENLINSKVIGRDNENLIKNDIKNFVLKKENIKSIEEYKQVIVLIKADLLGYVDEVEILDFIDLGESVFANDYESLLDNMFTNFNDPFGLFMRELSIFYSRVPKDVSLSNQNSIGNFINSKKIDNFKILTKDKLLSILLKIVVEEIDLNKKDLNKVVSFSNFFNEIYFTLFGFRLLNDDFKNIIKKYFTDEFESIFLKNDPRTTLVNTDYYFIANIFENLEEKEKIISQANSLINERSEWTNSDLNRKDYLVKGWDNFINYVEGVKGNISSGNQVKYNEFMNWLYTNQINGYLLVPSEEDVIMYKLNKSKK